MSNGTASDTDPIRDGDGGASGFGGDLDEDLATRLTRGVADGFAEASHAFSNEVAGSNRIPELLGRSLAGVIRANARLLDEVATVVRQAADGTGPETRPSTWRNVDYERLATMIAERLAAEKAAAARPVTTDPPG
jgi:hypothetical protein